MSRAALYDALEAYLAALGRKDPGAVNWAADPFITENNVRLAADDGLWGTIERMGDYRLMFADEKTRQVGYFGTVIEPLDESAYTVRLGLDEAGRIAEVETIVVRQVDSSPVFENQKFYDKPILNAGVEAPVSREEMIALSDGYFETLQRNDGTIRTKFHSDCNRVENGVQTTNNPEFAKLVPVAGLPCEVQFRTGNYRYDDRLRARRYPLVDEERGFVLAYGFIDHCGRLDHYTLTDGTQVRSHIRRPHTYYLGELFKIDHGMICQIEANFITVPYHMPSPWDAR
ncbi:MAG: hypothetical protein KKD64_02710 [Alphaproteobacteria bacterium]|nr:hypothetical protein [Alphaproteobacteria bacterium]MBU0794416.1 hypothetical protein [Alphaproteobacteria bacterium]MBU0874406.1 hypothetical protein [Alphaproteobacteria bacterium]MBU1768549.1 hypothetical protein [Alphaproteobacteria bacterium]